MSSLPQELPWHDADNKWAAILNPIINCPIVNGLQLSNVILSIGYNVINHKLGRKLQGYIVTSKNANANIYDTQASNQMPQLTLNLTSDAAVVISLWVY